MLYDAWKFVIYLSILSTTTSSSYLSKDSLVNHRHASPSSLANDQASPVSIDGEGYDWAELSNVESPQSQSDYLMPQFVNVNNMLYTQLVNGDGGNSKNVKRISSKRLSQRARGKKDNNNKINNSKNNKLTNLIKNYENLSMKNNIASSYNDESNNDERNATNNMRMPEDDNTNRKYNLTSNNSLNIPEESSPHRTVSLQNEYPMGQIATESDRDRELQQLFGIEGAKKYQNYQLQQQLSKDNQQQQFPLKPEEEGVELKISQTKRNGDVNAEEIQDVAGALPNQIMPRATRRQREYDVPLIQCPPATDGMERFACPTPDRQGRYRCIDDHVLCDGFIDCPEGADEDRKACMFYKTTKAHLDVLADALLRWARGR